MRRASWAGGGAWEHALAGWSVSRGKAAEDRPFLMYIKLKSVLVIVDNLFILSSKTSAAEQLCHEVWPCTLAVQRAG